MIATAPRAEAVRGRRRHSIAHAEDPAHPGTALCGARLRGRPASPGSERCVVCHDLARRTYIAR